MEADIREIETEIGQATRRLIDAARALAVAIKDEHTPHQHGEWIMTEFIEAYDALEGIEKTIKTDQPVDGSPI